MQRTGRRRLTFIETDVELSAWTTSNRVVFIHALAGRLRPIISAQPAEGTGAAENLGEGCCPSFSTDGTMVFAQTDDARESDVDLYYLRPGDAAPKVLLERTGMQHSPAISPNGAYVAYQSNESGRFEIYVRPFPSGSGQWQVSLAGGGEPRWSAKGDKLWFRAYGNVLMEVAITSTATTFAFGEPREVFKGDPIAVDLTLGYQPLGDGERFIAARRVPDPDGSVPSITVVQNWFAEFSPKR
jgi:serine/threonine-protein kinase